MSHCALVTSKCTVKHSLTHISWEQTTPYISQSFKTRNDQRLCFSIFKNFSLPKPIDWMFCLSPPCSSRGESQTLIAPGCLYATIRGRHSKAVNYIVIMVTLTLVLHTGKTSLLFTALNYRVIILTVYWVQHKNVTL